MRVVHLSFSSSGGAGLVARELCAGQVSMGLDSRALFMTNRGILPLWRRNPLLLGRALLDFFVVRRRRNSPLFSLFREISSRYLGLIPSGSDVIVHLHWVPGVITSDDLSAISQRVGGVVWTLHDMWPMTGGCHHSLGCNQYLEACGRCPQVWTPFQIKVQETHQAKRNRFLQKENLHVVAPSSWMEKIALDCGTFDTHRVHMIHNPIDEVFFETSARTESRSALEISRSAFVFGLSASNLNDPVKGVHRALRLLDQLGSQSLSREVVVLLIGSNAPSSMCRYVRIVETGFLDSREELADALSGIDVFVSLSQADTAPLAAAEALAMGVPLLCSDVGGLSELCDSGNNGIAVRSDSEFLSAASLMMGDERELTRMSINASQFAVANFHNQSVAARYSNLYQDILSR